MGSRVESLLVGPQSRAKEGGRNALRSCSKYVFTAGPWPLALPLALPCWVDSGWPGFPLCMGKGRAGSRSTEPSRREWVLGQLPTAWPLGSREGRAHSELSFARSVG